MQLPQEKADKGKSVLSFKLAPDVKTDLASSDLRRIEAGAKVVRLEAVRLNTGEVLAQRIVVETMAGAAEGAAGHASPRARQAGFGRAPGGNAGCQP